MSGFSRWWLVPSSCLRYTPTMPTLSFYCACCIHGLSPWHMASVVWCIISLRWCSFQTLLEMPTECACMNARHTRHTANTAYISSWMYLYFRIYKLQAISISTGYEPSYHNYVKSHDLSCDLFHDVQKSLKNPIPRHCSNSRINSTKSQLHHKPSPRSHDDILWTCVQQDQVGRHL